MLTTTDVVRLSQKSCCDKKTKTKKVKSCCKDKKKNSGRKTKRSC